MNNYDAADVLDSPLVQDCINELAWACIAQTKKHHGEHVTETASVNLRCAIYERCDELAGQPEPIPDRDDLGEAKAYRDNFGFGEAT